MLEKAWVDTKEGLSTINGINTINPLPITLATYVNQGLLALGIPVLHDEGPPFNRIVIFFKKFHLPDYKLTTVAGISHESRETLKILLIHMVQATPLQV